MHSVKVLHLWKRIERHRVLCANQPGRIDVFWKISLSCASTEGVALLCRPAAAAAEHSFALPCLHSWVDAGDKGKVEPGLLCPPCTGSSVKHRSHHVVRREESCPVLSVPKREGVMVTDSPSCLDALLCWRRK